ncbi:MAG: dTMP kinase [Ignavibacteriales bacterium]|jgi:dTMP kinase|nr:dTMP kinase [Ignavibacteriales bacterium]MBK7980026.1 dTMP kinase [Ignavibacteriota bacterium]
MFITFEGLDFCGKSTQVKLLQEYLTSRNLQVSLIREPGGVKISEKIRNIILDRNNEEMFFETELLLFSASRAQLVREVIIPKLEEGFIVISDRFHDSSIAYQGFGRELNVNFVSDLQKFAIGNAVPDLTFFLDIPVEEVNRRKSNVQNSELDRIEISKNSFYEKVRNGYKNISENEERFITIDGLMSVEKIHEKIKVIVENLLKDKNNNG